MENKCKSTLRATDVLGNGFELFKNNIKDIIILLLIFTFIPLIVISILTYLGVGVLNTVILTESFSSILIIPLILICLVISIFPTMGYISIIKIINIRSKDEEYTWENAVKYGFGSICKIICLNLLIFVVVFCLGILTFLILMLLPSIIISLIIILAIVFISFYFIFTYTSMAVHDLGVIDSIKYSFNIVRGRYLNVLGKRLLVFLLAIGITLVTNLLALIPILGVLIAIIIGSLLNIYVEITTLLVMFQDYDSNGFINNK